jgi:hypothetical protein
MRWYLKFESFPHPLPLPASQIIFAASFRIQESHLCGGGLNPYGDPHASSAYYNRGWHVRNSDGWQGSLHSFKVSLSPEFTPPRLERWHLRWHFSSVFRILLLGGAAWSVCVIDTT